MVNVVIGTVEEMLFRIYEHDLGMDIPFKLSTIQPARTHTWSEQYQAVSHIFRERNSISAL